MSLISRAKSSTKIRHFLLPIVTPTQQSNSYSTKTTQYIQKTQQFTNRRTRDSSDGIELQTGENIVWPKPIEMPYQAKVANRVDLIGYVRTVQFEKASGGNSFAAILIAQEISGEKETLLIPVEFEGDLAQVVASHVRVNNGVLVSGKLSTCPMRFPLRDFPVHFHVVAENLNFVKGYSGDFSERKCASFPGVEIKRGDEKVKMADGNCGDDVNQQLKQALENAKMKWKSTPASAKLSADSGAEKIDLVEAKPEKCIEKKGESAMEKKQKDNYYDDWNQMHKAALKVKKCESNSVSPQLGTDLGSENLVLVDLNAIQNNGKIATKNIDNDILDLWRDLVKNPTQWWDFRDHKLNGMVELTLPDFEHKVTHHGLWIGTAPHWVLSELKKLDSDKVEECWKNLVDNPREWRDFRDHKSKGLVEEEFPDFERRVTRDRLWVETAPHWVLSELERLKFDDREDSWRNLVENPKDWTDKRLSKRLSKYDFRHIRTGEVLWVDEAPAWVLSKLPPLKYT